MTLSLLSTCSLGVVSAYTWLALWVLSPSPPVAGVWWAHTLDWLYDSLYSPPVAGVWWAHTLDWLYDLSPPLSSVAGVWWAHTLDWLYDSLYSPPVAVCGERIHLIGSMTLLISTWDGVWWEPYTWLSLWPFLSHCSWCLGGESIHLIGSMLSSSPL